MRRDAFVVLAPLLLVVVAGATLTAAHTCGHDALFRKEYGGGSVPDIGLAPEEPAAVGVYEVQGKDTDRGFKSLRIAVFSDDVHNELKYCSAVGDTRSDYQGNDRTCEEDDLLTVGKRNLLLKTILPQALQLHTERLLVQPVFRKVVVSQLAGGSCSQFGVPQAHSTTGLIGADFYLYVATAPGGATGRPWALTCLSLDGRPVVGMLNVPPSAISTNPNVTRLVAHELLHALGFNQDVFRARGMLTTLAQVRGKKGVVVVSSPRVLLLAREYFGCDRAPGMELEDQGDAATVGSHWKRRNVKDELMTGQVGEDLIYSALTLAAMEDTGYYRGVYSRAEQLTWGHQLGCSFLEEKCMENDVTKWPSMFCNEMGNLRCTSNRLYFGLCQLYYTADLPPHFQYFGSKNYGSLAEEMMDYCPILTPHKQYGCADGDIDRMAGSILSPDSRCFDAPGGIKVEGSTTLKTTFCLQVTCDPETQSYSILIKDAVIPEPCAPGSNLRLSDYSDAYGEGEIVCPPYIEVCLLTQKNVASKHLLYPAAFFSFVALLLTVFFM